MEEMRKETVVELTRSRLYGLESELTRAVFTGACREDIDEVIDSSRASDPEAHRAGGEQRTA